MVPSIVGLAQWNWSELTKVVNIGEVKANTANANPIFRGKVSVQKITGESSDEFRIIAVNFSLEAVNAFHTHTFDQVLHVDEYPEKSSGVPDMKGHWHHPQFGLNLIYGPYQFDKSVKLCYNIVV